MIQFDYCAHFSDGGVKNHQLATVAVVFFQMCLKKCNCDAKSRQKKNSWWSRVGWLESWCVERITWFADDFKNTGCLAPDMISYVRIFQIIMCKLISMTLYVWTSLRRLKGSLSWKSMTSHICIYSGIYYIYMIWYDMIWYDMICLHATHMDDAIMRQPHVELCSQHGTSRIMQLSKWTEQRKNKSQNHKKNAQHPLVAVFCIFLFFNLKQRKHTESYFYCTHTREKRPTTNPQPAPQRIRQKSSGQSGFFCLPGRWPPWNEALGDDSWRERREKLTPNGGGDLVREIPGYFRGNLGEIF